MQPLYLDPAATGGPRIYRDGMGTSTVPRLYHSTALLLPDGSVFLAGSNPNADYVGTNARNNPYPTGWSIEQIIEQRLTDVLAEYRSEAFYPSYYNNTRPEPTGLPQNLTYGGAVSSLFPPSRQFL